jgi:hypothetical protein
MINSRRKRWAGHAARMGESTGLHRAFVGKLEGKRPPEKRRRRWQENIRMNLKKKQNGDVEWTGKRIKSFITDQPLVSEFPSIVAEFITRYPNYLFTQQQTHQLQ